MVGIKDNIRKMAGYVPGEQPRGSDFIKLNTNENPYPPSPKVLEAIRSHLTSDKLRKYPEPLGEQFRQTAGKVLKIDPESILIGNGSDDILTILIRAFVPEMGLVASLHPSYILYRSLAEIQNAQFELIPFTPDWQIPIPCPCQNANIQFLANPNSPTGTMVSRANLLSWLNQNSIPTVIDEAYGDFADENALSLASDRVIITRSFSKSYSLAGMRIGFAVASPMLIRELIKVKDSYNCDVLSLAAAAAAIADQDYFLECRSKIITTRKRLELSLTHLGFQVVPSQANFVWAKHPVIASNEIYQQLKIKNILIRYMNYPSFGDGLRISVGTDAEIDQLLFYLDTILKGLNL